VDHDNPTTGDTSRVIDVARTVADEIEAVFEAGALPLAIGGDCAITLGVAAGIQRCARDPIRRASTKPRAIHFTISTRARSAVTTGSRAARFSARSVTLKRGHTVGASRHSGLDVGRRVRIHAAWMNSPPRAFTTLSRCTASRTERRLRIYCTLTSCSPRVRLRAT